MSVFWALVGLKIIGDLDGAKYDEVFTSGYVSTPKISVTCGLHFSLCMH